MIPEYLPKNYTLWNPFLTWGRFRPWVLVSGSGVSLTAQQLLEQVESEAGEQHGPGEVPGGSQDLRWTLALPWAPQSTTVCLVNNRTRAN